MREVKSMIVVPGPLRRDHERRRWYGGGGSTWLVLTARGRLLEPYPTYGPREYRLLARNVNVGEASFTHSITGTAICAWWTVLTIRTAECD